MGEKTTPEIVVESEPDIVVQDEEHAEEQTDSLSVLDEQEQKGWVVFDHIYKYVLRSIGLMMILKK